MFHHQSLLYVCTLSPLLLLSHGQTYFHTSHGGGPSYTSISHGAGLPVQVAHAQTTSYAAPAQPAYSAPAQPAYAAPQPFVHHQQTTYHAPAPAYHAPAPAYHAAAPAYHAPAPAYHAPAPAYHAPVHHTPVPHVHAAAPSYGEKCAVEHVEEPAEVCVPTLETNCKHEEGGEGLRLRTDEKCSDVVRTVCVERHTVVDNEVCAFSYTLRPVATEAKLVEVHWAEVCHHETICLNPHRVQSGYGAPAPAYCHEEVHETCHLEPTLEPVVRHVTVSLPQPVEVCINKQIVLPFLECEKVKDRHCMIVPRAEKGHKYQIDKCTVELGEPTCQQTVLQLPRQACLERVERVETVYTTEKKASYSG